MLRVLLCVTGNDSGGECGVATARRFIMPEAYLDAAQQEAANHGSSVNSPFWYSFDYGSVHFVMLSTEHDVTPGSHQYRVSSWYMLSLSCTTQISLCFLLQFATELRRNFNGNSSNSNPQNKTKPLSPKQAMHFSKCHKCVALVFFCQTEPSHMTTEFVPC